MPVAIPTLSVAPSTIVARLASGDLLDATPISVRAMMFDGVPITPATIAAGDLVLIQDLDNSLALRTVTTQSIADLIGAGDVQGPASATDNALARFNLTTGKLIQNSVALLTDPGVLTGLTGLTSVGLSTLTNLRVLGTLADTSGDVGVLGQFLSSTVAGTDWVTPTAASVNLVINGNFNIWQRGATFTAPVDVYTADRWAWRSVGTGVVDILRSTNVPNGLSEFSLHVDVTTADAALATTDFYGLEYRVEGFDAIRLGLGTADATSITVSFWAMSPLTGIHSVAFQNSAIDRSYVAEYTIAVADTWEFQTVTIVGDTAGTWLRNNGIGLAVIIALASGPDRDTTPGSWQAGDFKASVNQVNVMDNAANNFRIAQVKVEAAAGPTPFTDLNHGDELARAKRYYIKTFATDVAPAQNTGDLEGSFSYRITGDNNPATGPNYQYTWFHPVTMRIDGARIFYNTNNTNSNWRNGVGADSGTSNVQGASNTQQTVVNNSVAVADAVGDFVTLHCTVDAEL